MHETQAAVSASGEMQISLGLALSALCFRFNKRRLHGRFDSVAGAIENSGRLQAVNGKRCMSCVLPSIRWKHLHYAGAEYGVHGKLSSLDHCISCMKLLAGNAIH